MKTPKEKAKELIDKFFDYVEAMTSNQQNENAKQCALICVDEIIEELDAYNRHGGLNGRINFLIEVKSEIEKL